MIYITVPDKIFNERLKYLIPSVDRLNFKIKDENDIVCLYAWTQKKKYVKRFLSERCNRVFNVKAKEMDDDEFTSFIEYNSALELKPDNISLNSSYDGYERNVKAKIVDNENFVNLITTYFETSNYSDNKRENMEEFGPQVDANTNYDLFNDHIVKALTILGYVTIYDSRYSQNFPESDEVIARYEKAMRVENLLDTKSDLIAGLLKTEYIVFIYLYSYTFVGR